MARITEFLRWPVTTVRQAWGDYKVGRAIRQSLPKVDYEEETEGEEGCDEECREVCKEKCEEETLDQCEEARSDVKEDPCDDVASPTEPSPRRNEEQELAAKYKEKLARSWRYCGEREFPWIHTRLVYEESNWRGTWVVEVKDVRATMNWKIEKVPEETGRELKYNLFKMETRVLIYTATEDAWNGPNRTRSEMQPRVDEADLSQVISRPPARDMLPCGLTYPTPRSFTNEIVLSRVGIEL
ncbi:uncharacterized protein TRIVIDRAFT_69823 [Trichoderma virens Gv29-8]|uniref:Uncharacterized protein n=1 Tax=Hypocrea virens (strain Gv29-8 / FGSC 10586) TaxID=413071 RepID=G9N218_HYPVG|nr:uncharacterized protein TRIVIDRAFT_69823 [Trichoderma virens Gv29-8]EHK19134.1 hypothetical protein TRIVIDRAFT_69823 [Trichoderma virens Gv29-8]UKZ49413.1 hypothetical protein TrVGV298_003660 [Trichoderma virens]